jgi:hypothetical protein
MAIWLCDKWSWTTTLSLNRLYCPDMLCLFVTKFRHECIFCRESGGNVCCPSYYEASGSLQSSQLGVTIAIRYPHCGHLWMMVLRLAPHCNDLVEVLTGQV